MSLRSACILLGLLLLGAVRAPSSGPPHRGDSPAGALALHVVADLAQSNAPHEDAVAGLRRVGAPMRAPRLEGLAGGSDDLPHPDTCRAADAAVHCRRPSSMAGPHPRPRGDTGQALARAHTSRAPPAAFALR